MGTVFLSEFQCPKPTFQKEQSESFEWLLSAYQRYQKKQTYTGSDYSRLLNRVGVSPDQVSKRGHFLQDFRSPVSPSEEQRVFLPDRMMGISVRQYEYLRICQNVVEKLYSERDLPEQWIHVSCTGYVSPSPLQRLASQRAPESMVTHAYHMGCYGAFPAVRMAAGFVQNPISSCRKSVDVVHTELCTLHLNPQDPSLEQIVIQSLFADGVAVYRISSSKPMVGFELIHLSEFLLPGTESAMTWGIEENGFAMTLSKDVPRLISSEIREAFGKWEKQAGIEIRALLKDACFAIHPGGPKILDAVREALELKESQIAFSRQVLRDHGNMSSATVPHIWNEILRSGEVASGTPVISMAFGPGLTLCLSLMRVV